MSSAGRIPTIVTTPIPARENAQAKARRLLVQGSVRVQLVRAGRCSARVNGDSGVYDVGCSRGCWHCSCPAYGTSCSHIRAVQFVVDLSGAAPAPDHLCAATGNRPARYRDSARTNGDRPWPSPAFAQTGEQL